MTGRVKVIAYYRVSTQRQGITGLGLDAQRTAVAADVKANGATLWREYTEIESGKRVQRPELARALSECRAVGAILVIAKLDRLARNVAFLSALMDGDVEFRALDMPQASRLYLHIMGAVAEHEARAIGERTRAALQVAKARGVKLGTRAPVGGRQPWTRAQCLAGLKTLRANADAHVRPILPLLHQWQRAGWSHREMAAGLTFHGFRTFLGVPWSKRTVHWVLHRVARARKRRERWARERAAAVANAQSADKG